MDVRDDPIGSINRFLNWVFMGWKPRLLRRLISIIFHIELPVLRHPVRMGHPFNIIVNGRTQIGRNVTLYQGVTIGSKRTGEKAGVPMIGDDVVIYPNAVIIGKVFIGNGATIGAGAIVLNDVPNFSTVVGNPARVIGSKENLTVAEL